MPVHELFPVRIYSETVGFEPADHAAVIALIQRMQRSVHWQSGEAKPFSSATGDHISGDSASQFHRLPQLSWLSTTVMRSAHHYLEALGAATDAYCIHIQKAWPVIVGSGHGLNRHRHRNAHISAVYYMGAMDADAGALSFQRADSHPEAFIPIYRRNQQSWNWQPEEGQLLLFPSELEHQVEPHRGDAYRYSISFDLLISTHARNRINGSNEMLMTHPATWNLETAG